MLSWSGDSNTVFFRQGKEAFAYSLALQQFRELAGPDSSGAIVPCENGGYALATGVNREIEFHVYDALDAPYGSFSTGIVSDGNDWPLSTAAYLGEIKSSRCRRFCAFWRDDDEFSRLYVIDFRLMTCTVAYETENFGIKLSGKRFEWSPNGKWIASSSYRYRKGRALHADDSVLITDVRDGKTRRCPIEPKEISPPIRLHGWATDGQRLLLSDFKCRETAVVLDVVDGTRKSIKLPGGNKLPYFGPDGDVAFQRRGPMDK